MRSSLVMLLFVRSTASGLVQMPRVLVPIAQMGFVFTALLGFALYREPMTVRKGIGLAAALAALAAFAAS